MRVLVVGGTGFIGSVVVRQLTALGHGVTAFHRGISGSAHSPEVNQIIGDHRNLRDFKAAFRQLAPDVVVDMILGTERRARDLMESVRGSTARVVVISSIDVYRAYGRVRGFEPGPPDPVPLDEDAPLRERLRPHGAAEISRMNQTFTWFEDDYEKIEVEIQVMSDPELPATILRLPAVYGPGDPLHRLFPELKRMVDGRPAILIQDNVARWRWSRGYVENVAHAITLAVTEARAVGRVYNVADQDALSHEDWTKVVGRAFGWSGEIVVLPKEQMPDHLKNPLESDQDWVVDTTRIRQELGYTEIVPRQDYLERTIGWERVNPPQQVRSSAFDYTAEDRVLAAIR